MLWLTSDTHFDHRNILKHAERPFIDIDEMNEVLIRNWNTRVRRHDLVIHAGDFGFGPKDKLRHICSRLNGRKYLVSGNHDKSDQAMREIGFERVYSSFVLRKERLYIKHSAHEVGRNKFNEYTVCAGHTHTRDGVILIKENGITVAKALDLGVDANNFSPISLDELLQLLRLTLVF